MKNPVTLRVPVGISLQELMDAAGGPTCDCKYIIGGPCMGRVVDTLDIPVTKTTGGLLAIPKDHPLLERKSPKLNLQLIMSVCCQCSMCTQMCPRNALGLNVQPHKAMRSLASGGDLLGEFNGIFSCCNCGLCTYYACNFGLKPSQVMQTLKSAIASKGVRPRKEVYGPVDGGLENKKVPVERLIARLGIADDGRGLVRHLVLEGVEQLRLRLVRRHAGHALEAVVHLPRGLFEIAFAALELALHG